MNPEPGLWPRSGQGCVRLPAGQDEHAGRPRAPTGAMWLTLLLLAVLLLAAAHRVFRGLFPSGSPNPFSEDVKRPPAPLVTDKDARKKVLKQGQRKGPRGPRPRGARLPSLEGRAAAEPRPQCSRL